MFFFLPLPSTAYPAVPMSISSSPTQHLAPLGLGPGPPSGLSLPGHVEEEEWDLDVKPIPRGERLAFPMTPDLLGESSHLHSFHIFLSISSAETSDSEGASPSHREFPGQARGSLPGSSSALGQHQSVSVHNSQRFFGEDDSSSGSVYAISSIP